MQKKLVLATICVLAFLVPPALGDILPGVLGLRILPDEGVYIVNPSQNPVAFDGYEIRLPPGPQGYGYLNGVWDPVAQTGWRSFEDWIGENLTEAFAALGSVTWGQTAPPKHSETEHETLLAELNLSGSTTLGPGEMLWIGRPIGPAHAGPELRFFYHGPSDGGDKRQGGLDVVPEPGSLLMLLAAALAVAGLAWRRRP